MQQPTATHNNSQQLTTTHGHSQPPNSHSPPLHPTTTHSHAQQLTATYSNSQPLRPSKPLAATSQPLDSHSTTSQKPLTSIWARAHLGPAHLGQGPFGPGPIGPGPIWAQPPDSHIMGNHICPKLPCRPTALVQKHHSYENYTSVRPQTMFSSFYCWGIRGWGIRGETVGRRQERSVRRGDLT